MSSKDQALLQRRLYLAENTPEPVFDLSDCHLTAVPSGVSSKCRVFRKTSLLLQNNLLTKLPDLRDLVLLTVLNVSCNQLKKLPDSIGALINLEILDAHTNQLVKLPSSMSKLRALKSLDVSGNKLSYLPPGLRSMGCKIKADGCPLLEQLDSKCSDSGDEAAPEHKEEDEPEPDLGGVWKRREKMLEQLRAEMVQMEDRLHELTVYEYEKRDRQREDTMMNIAQERVELAASLGELIQKREVELMEFKTAGVFVHVEESGVTDRDCVVCLENGLALVVLMPCGHVCVCRDCCEKITTCPLCREPISQHGQ